MAVTFSLTPAFLLSLLSHTTGGFVCERCCPRVPQASILLELRTISSPGHGSLSNDTGLQWGPGAVGQDTVTFEPKDSLKLKKKSPEFPKCLHRILPHVRLHFHVIAYPGPEAQKGHS